MYAVSLLSLRLTQQWYKPCGGLGGPIILTWALVTIVVPSLPNSCMVREIEKELPREGQAIKMWPCNQMWLKSDFSDNQEDE